VPHSRIVFSVWRYLFFLIGFSIVRPLVALVLKIFYPVDPPFRFSPCFSFFPMRYPFFPIPPLYFYQLSPAMTPPHRFLALQAVSLFVDLLRGSLPNVGGFFPPLQFGLERWLCISVPWTLAIFGLEKLPHPQRLPLSSGSLFLAGRLCPQITIFFPVRTLLVGLHPPNLLPLLFLFPRSLD